MTPGHATTRPSVFAVFLAVACLVLCALVVWLGRQNGQLKTELAEAQARAARANVHDTAAAIVGRRLAALTGIDPAGNERAVALDAPGRRLVMLASAHCPTCESVRPFWHEAGQHAGAAGIEAVCLLTDERPTAEDLVTLGVPVYQVKGFRESSVGNIPLVPALLLMRDGVVERAWLGSPEGEAAGEIRAALVAL